MLGPLNIALDQFGISPHTGFLPEEQPLRRLNQYYKDWEDIVDEVPALLRNKTFRFKAERLPLLSVSRLQTEREWQRAYVLLSFITHSYIWGGHRPAEILPRAISVPFLAVSAHLGLPATATYSALNLWNFTCLPDSDLSIVENSSILYTFTGTLDEAWFYRISIAIEAQGAYIIPIMLKAVDAVRMNDPQIVTSCLFEFGKCLEQSGNILQRMYEKCSPEVFYHKIRPFLAGSKNMASAGLPNGVFYEECNRKGQWRQYSGGSNAQSSLIQFFDVILGVEHSPTKHSRKAETTSGGNHNYLKEMRKYMPRGHRLFIEQVESESNIRDYVQQFSVEEDIMTAYNTAVSRLAAFRDIHIQIVARYIIAPSRKPLQSLSDGVNIATVSSNRSSMTGLSGTGGTELMPFLKQSRDETRETTLP
ncbi:hypothetical protein OIDMADRAFT_146019 [Oidiodendron maius Zn]|uniref:Indoleamine 2,3-dioxygenase n=1 Tax=Oidiodendron maius (strain Zn) TaxID=913774 RepID=A0A0C3GWZ1_OIDMZ|nr:hypothetical protein OIDMADRAFT_146019 [Oidiodendron maius Zn]